tara:strand:- start:182 stop:907 length:726 start_codon:yes stop_codon:yes gene_type:complete
MSTLELEHIKHTSSSSNNLSVNSDGSIGAVTIANNGSNVPLTIPTNISTHEIAFTGSTHANIAANNGANPFYIQSIGAGDMYFQTNSSNRMHIESDGVIHMPNQPSALFQGNDGSWATINAGNVMNRAFTTSGNGAHAHSSITYNQSNGRFTMTKAGKYFVSFTFYCDAAANNDMRIILRQNGGGIAFNHYDFPSTQSTIGNSSSACLNIAANDYIDFYTPYQVSNYGGPQHTFVNIFKVS